MAEKTKIEQFREAYARHREAGQREGQARINALFEVDNDLAELLKGGEADCYYQDHKKYYFDEVVYPMLQRSEPGDPWAPIE